MISRFCFKIFLADLDHNFVSEGSSSCDIQNLSICGRHFRYDQSISRIFESFEFFGGFFLLSPTVRPEVSSLLAAGSQPLPLGIRVEVGSG